MPGLALDEGEVHVWLADPGAIGTDDRLRAGAVLAPEEVARGDQFQSPEHRLRYLVVHALVRCALSRYADVDPRSWRFQASEHGRPEIAGPAAGERLAFNLSRTNGLVACAIARCPQVGVDVAATDSSDVLMRVADRFFRPAELADLRSLPPHLQRGRFFDFWTLKEAYVKARGRGLRVPLAGFTFHLGPPVTLEIEGPSADAEAGWQFALWSPTPRHRAALALRTTSGKPLRTRTEWWKGEEPVTSTGTPTLGS